ncbi:MAG: discoidin domain-containing protein [Candidatus Sericytochromatia bacterium]|nr:discoidin domain-containing protein [Candidatus Sericytochromatia bacterium]
MVTLGFILRAWPLFQACRSKAFAASMIWVFVGGGVSAAPLEILALSASSSSGMLMDAVDGDPQTRWQNKRPGEKDAWLAVRMKKATVLRGVRLDWGPHTDSTQVFIEVSPQGEAFRRVLTVPKGVTPGPHTYVFSKALPALYLRVRFQFTGPGTAPQFGIAELEPLGSED